MDVMNLIPAKSRKQTLTEWFQGLKPPCQCKCSIADLNYTHVENLRRIVANWGFFGHGKYTDSILQECNRLTTTFAL